MEVNHLLPPPSVLQKANVRCRDYGTLRQPPQSGDLVWVVERGHMPWSGKIVRNIEAKNVGVDNNGPEQTVQVQMLGMQGQQADTEDCTATDIPMDQLVPLHEIDIPVVVSPQAEVASLLAKISNATHAADDAKEATGASTGKVSSQQRPYRDWKGLPRDSNHSTEGSVGMARPTAFKRQLRRPLQRLRLLRQLQRKRRLRQ